MDLGEEKAVGLQKRTLPKAKGVRAASSPPRHARHTLTAGTRSLLLALGTGLEGLPLSPPSPLRGKSAWLHFPEAEADVQSYPRGSLPPRRALERLPQRRREARLHDPRVGAHLPGARGRLAPVRGQAQLGGSLSRETPAPAS